MLSKLLIDELKIIIKEDYSEEISNQEVDQMANNLVNYFDLLAKIDYREKSKVENPDLLTRNK